MSLASAVAALASRLATELNTLRGEMAAGLTGKANSSHTHGAGDVTSGTLAVARVPTGTSGTTVALGNHTHSYLDQSAGDARYRQHNQAPRTLTVSTSTANADVGAAGDLQITVSTVTSTTITPTNGQNGRTCVIDVTAASGATRTVIIGGSPKKGEGISAAQLAIPAGGIGRFVIRYTTLGSAAYSVDSCYLVA
ncbi:hypothetical protein [Pseudonocardia sp. N23]|uniref:hypothetical protein n=1 Tax=Pseudonocardia sp. N23 TaxID=1987376 RepID=UPI000BFCEC30|nr:hypothetical protein [Pseudonocardia sp. N23]GAY12020.1 phage tail fiber protein [Pseudonocardia sp. N23]